MSTEPSEPLSNLEAVRHFIAAQSRVLDPASRYISELVAIVDRARDVGDLEALLEDGSRGQYWAGPDTFRAMSLADKLRVNLVTNETSLMRFDAAEFAFLRSTVVPALARRGRARVWSAPCSHGEEPVSLAIELIEAGVTEFAVDGCDVQAACIETARSGTIPLSGLPRLVKGLVDPSVMAHLRFAVGDLLAEGEASPWVAAAADPYDLVVCRNFLGYFTGEVVAWLLARLARAVAPGGFLLLDGFILGKHPERFEGFPLARCEGLPFFSRG